MNTAKATYDAFHDAMGNLQRVPFEHLSMRETEAWKLISGLNEIGYSTLLDLRRELSEARRQTARSEWAHGTMREELEELRRVNEALRQQIHSFDESFEKPKCQKTNSHQPNRRKKSSSTGAVENTGLPVKQKH